MSAIMAETGRVDQYLPSDSEAILNFDPSITQSTYFAHGQVYVDKTPVNYSAEFPQNRIYDGLAIIEPGFGGFKRTSRPLRRALAQAGIATVSYEPVRDDSYGNWARLTNSQEAHARTVQAVSDDLHNHSLDDVPSTKIVDFDRQLLIPHSMGGLAAAGYAEQDPDKIDGIINLSAVGYGAPNPKQLAKTMPGGIMDALKIDIIPTFRTSEFSLSPLNLARIIRYYFRNPLRTIGEMKACLTSDIRPTVKDLSQQHDIKTAFIAFENDHLIPPNDEIKESVDIYTVMPNSRHTAPQRKATQVADMIVRTADQLGSLN